MSAQKRVNTLSEDVKKIATVSSPPYSLQSDFDVEQHKKHFVNYLEVLIDENGKVMYAVPSHQMKAEEICCDKLHISRTELRDSCPREYYGDYLVWLLQQCKCISVWNDFYEGVPNRKQIEALKMLKMHGVYHGIVLVVRRNSND